MKPIILLDESLQVEIFYESDDCGYEDNICLEDEKIFLHDESHLYLTPKQAQDLAEALLEAVKASKKIRK